MSPRRRLNGPRRRRLFAATFGPSGEQIVAVVGLLVVLMIVSAAGVGLDRLAFDAWSGILTLTALVALTLPVLAWLARKEGDPHIASLLIWGMVATIVGVLVRYVFVTVVYNDSADAGVYAAGAGELAKAIKQGTFTTVPPGLENFPAESQRIGVVLAFVYLLTGTSRWAGSIVFAWFAFGGRLLMWRALRRAVPEADDKRYLVFLLFFPSLLYWPASIGKEALMILAIGVVRGWAGGAAVYPTAPCSDWSSGAGRGQRREHPRRNRSRRTTEIHGRAGGGVGGVDRGSGGGVQPDRQVLWSDR